LIQRETAAEVERSKQQQDVSDNQTQIKRRSLSACTCHY